ncbi:hypothetical protein BDW59DRAFT_155660 [Aspergillus cavernicola]|uniref:Uncharacterized protein n=1 Tax=Aspergillus cavernicola TaxID=176166 RepID=A0ABR4H280_9EURO
MRLQEEGHKPVEDRSMQITDIILNLEASMKAKYRTMLQEKDNEIARLLHVHGEYGIVGPEEEKSELDSEDDAV